MPSLEDLPIDQLVTEAKRYQASDQLLGRLVSDPATREEALRLVKRVNPNLSIPEIDAKDQVTSAMAKDRERLEQLEAKLQDQEIRERIRAKRDEIRAKYNFTDSDIQAVEALMVNKDEPIPSYEAAAKVYKASQTPAVPTPSTVGAPTFEMPAAATWGAGVGNNAQLNKIALNEAHRVLQEMRKTS